MMLVGAVLCEKYATQSDHGPYVPFSFMYIFLNGFQSEL